ncbi:MAG: hypothetical protein J0H27_15530 [Xanthomonadales bacterium]|nr:hypothetical protein [Xanthomonadales bacterium]
MAKTRVNRLIGELAKHNEPKPFGLGDLCMLAGGLEVPPGFPGGNIAPANVPDGVAREQLRAKLEADFIKWDHTMLARFAAHSLEGVMLWRGVFAAYARDKEIALKQTTVEGLKQQYDAATEFLEVLQDPGTRAYLNAQAKLARDPKQAAKAKAFKLWQDWQTGRVRHKSGAAFARHVVDTLPIESTKTVERWVTQWRKDAKATK